MGDLILMTKIAGRRAAILSADIQSVVELDSVTPVPMAPGYVLGLTALRSRALTVIDTRAALGVDAGKDEPDTRVAVVEVEGHPYALVVDEVCDVVEAIDMKPIPETKLGDGWDRVATAMVETANGPALLVNVVALLHRDLAQAA